MSVGKTKIILQIRFETCWNDGTDVRNDAFNSTSIAVTVLKFYSALLFMGIGEGPLCTE